MFALPAGYPPDITAAFNILKTRTRLSLDDMRVLALIEAAGEEFYLRIAKGVSNPEAAALLKQNGREELGHAHRLLKAIVAAGGESFKMPAANERMIEVVRKKPAISHQPPSFKGGKMVSPYFAGGGSSDRYASRLTNCTGSQPTEANMFSPMISNAMTKHTIEMNPVVPR